jgi:hypothetical protein
VIDRLEDLVEAFRSADGLETFIRGKETLTEKRGAYSGWSIGSDR